MQIITLPQRLSSYDFGFYVGFELRLKLMDVLKAAGFDPMSMVEKEWYDKFLVLLLSECPSYVEELRGMADGAGVLFEVLLRFNLPELTWVRERELKMSGGNEASSINVDKKCTTLACESGSGGHNGAAQFMIAHNEDGEDYDELFVFKGILPSGRLVISCSYVGKLLGFSGSVVLESDVHDVPFFMVNTNLRCIDEGLGRPKVFVLREMLDLGTIEKCCTLLQVKRASGQHYLFAQGTQVVSVEASATKFEVKEVAGPFVHTNCYVNPTMLCFERRVRDEEGTFLRQTKASELMKAGGGLCGDVSDGLKVMSSFLTILSCHDDRPSCICAHGSPDYNKTIGVIVYDSTFLGLRVGAGVTCKAVLVDVGWG